MGKPLSEWRRRVDEILADGEWHDREEVVRDAMRFVPPGIAYRRGEYYRTKSLRGRMDVRKRGDEGDAIRAGQRAIVAETLQSVLKSGRVEKKKDAGQYLIRDTQATSAPAFKHVVQRQSEADEFAAELRRQITFWSHARQYLPKGDVGEALLGGDPIESIREVLHKHGKAT